MLQFTWHRSSAFRGQLTAADGLRCRLAHRSWAVTDRSVTNNGTLLAAAGAEGLVSLFALPAVDAIPRIAAAAADAEPTTGTPLATVPIHCRWIADVQWVSTANDLLLSAADDGLLQLSRVVTDGAAPQVVPLARLGPELHRGGIYSMEEVDGAIATSSKDDAVGVSTLHPAGGLAVTRVYRDIGAVRFDPARRVGV